MVCLTEPVLTEFEKAFVLFETDSCLFHVCVCKGKLNTFQTDFKPNSNKNKQVSNRTFLVLLETRLVLLEVVLLDIVRHGSVRRVPGVFLIERGPIYITKQFLIGRARLLIEHGQILFELFVLLFEACLEFVLLSQF